MLDHQLEAHALVVTPELRRAVDIVRLHSDEYRKAVRRDSGDDYRHGYRLREARNLAHGSMMNAKAALADLVVAAVERIGA